MNNTEEKKVIEEIRNEYGSVSKMIAKVENQVSYLKRYGGYMGRDGADTLERALYEIPSKYHRIFYKYQFTVPRP